MRFTTRATRLLWALGAVLATACGINRQGFVDAPSGDLAHVGVDRGRFDAPQQRACGSGGPSGGSAFVRWPYLQKVQPDGFELLWTTEARHHFTVIVTEPDGRTITTATAVRDRNASPPESALQYVAALDDLPADTLLCYQVVAEGRVWTRPTGVRTAPRDPDASVRFVAMGDLGKRSPDQLAVARQLRDVQFDFMLLTGDIAYDKGKRVELEQYFFDVYPDILATVPAFPASGNHDYRTEDAAPFREAFSLFDNGAPHGLDRWYSFDWGPVHVVVLDTEIADETQVRWLDRDLSDHDRPWTIAVQHRPAYSSGHHGSDDRARELFAPVFERHGVPLVLTGHDHHYERSRPIRGVVHVVTGGGGRGTRRTGRSDFTAVSARVAHFVWLEADASTLRMVAVDATGHEFDSLLLTR